MKQQLNKLIDITKIENKEKDSAQHFECKWHK